MRANPRGHVEKAGSKDKTNDNTNQDSCSQITPMPRLAALAGALATVSLLPAAGDGAASDPEQHHTDHGNSGPDFAAMGVHYVNGNLVGDGEIDASRPEALIYEPSADWLRLVGVEFIVDAATWTAHHNSPPVLEGQTSNLINSPNRFGLPAFYELHVWAWRDNPNGAFVDWNKRVTCERQ